MREYPTILESKFGDPTDEVFTFRDAEINSDILWAAVRLVHPKCLSGHFTAGHPWQVTIEDQHDSEETPHYILSFGERVEEINEKTLRFVRKIDYCDNFSTKSRRIEQAPGVFTVTLKGDFWPKSIIWSADVIAQAYIDSLRKNLPDYFILCNEDALGSW